MQHWYAIHGENVAFAMQMVDNYTWVDEEGAQKPCCCLPGLADMVEPHIAGQAGGEAPSGDLDAIRLLCNGQGGLPPMLIMG